MTSARFVKSRTPLPRVAITVAIACQIAILLTGLSQNRVFALGFISHHAHHKWAKKTNSSKSTPSYVLSNLQSTAIVPGVIYRKSRGALRINILDIDTVQAPVLIKPIVAPSGTPRLQTVNNLALSNHALAAVNANYFKNTGIPLGTLVIDGDWIAGPLYERVALGISRSGYPRIDKVNLGGMLSTSNLEAPKIWVNNVNQQHRTGSHVIAYTRRWGSFASLPYDGCLVAIDAQGEVVGRATRSLNIPYGGFVLTDSKDSLLSSLRVGDLTYLHWQVTPNAWEDVTEAVSGGPMLIKNGSFCVDLQAEKFRGSWASGNIKARTGCGVTADNHLVLVTVEGSHTIFDLPQIYVLKHYQSFRIRSLHGVTKIKVQSLFISLGAAVFIR